MTDFQKELNDAFEAAEKVISNNDYKVAKAAALFTKPGTMDFASCDAKLVGLNAKLTSKTVFDCAYTTAKDGKATLFLGYTDENLDPNKNEYSCISPVDATTSVNFFIQNLDTQKDGMKLFLAYAALKNNGAMKTTVALKNYKVETDDANLKNLAIYDLNAEARDIFPLYAAIFKETDQAKVDDLIKVGEGFLDNVDSFLGCLGTVRAVIHE